MPYACELGSGQTLYLGSQGAQTLVGLATVRVGQQQQASSLIPTGSWTREPEVFCTPMQVIVKLHTDEGDRHIQVQGGQISLTHVVPSVRDDQRMRLEWIEHLPDFGMEPMRMGSMEMGLKPMTLRMGNMNMSMGSMGSDSSPGASASTSFSRSSSTSSSGRSPSPQPSGTDTHPRRFCTQCGAPVKPQARFCQSCGSALDPVDG